VPFPGFLPIGHKTRAALDAGYLLKACNRQASLLTKVAI